MSKAEKYRLQMQNNPRDWRIEQMDVVAAHYGFGRVEAKGSHVKYYHKQLPEIFVVPAKRPIKPIYVRKLLELIERLEEQ